MDNTNSTEIKERPGKFNIDVVETAIPIESEILDIAPLNSQCSSTWLIVDTAGVLYRLDADQASCDVVGRIPYIAEPDFARRLGSPVSHKLYVSSNGGFVAVANDYGTAAVVMSLADSRVIRLRGGDYHSDIAALPFAFIEHEGRTLFIHRTSWNRLDISDPENGALLTQRISPACRSEEGNSEHYLDYFHGRLLVSPDGALVADDGWVWGSSSHLEIFSLSAWLAGNMWESEDGPSKVTLFNREHCESPMCWIDSAHIAVGLLEDDEGNITDGVTIFDTSKIEQQTQTQGSHSWTWRQAEEQSSFPGLGGKLFACDETLYSADASGLCIWDTTDGARIGMIPGFSPTHQHPGTRELAEIKGKIFRRWKILIK